MRPNTLTTAVLFLTSTAVSAAKSNLTKPLSSENVLSAVFVPPQVFKNINLVHVISLEKSFPKESINVVIENTDTAVQNEYYIPFTPEQMEKIGSLEVTDRKNKELGLFQVEAVEFDTAGYVRYRSVSGPI